MLNDSPAHFRHFEQVLTSIKSRMKPPNELNRYQAKILVEKLSPEEHDVFVGLTHWNVTRGFINDNGFLTLDSLDTRREYGPIMHSSILITNRQVFLLAQKHHFVLTVDVFEGWDLGKHDTVRMASIEIELSSDKGNVEFKIQKNQLGEFREAMLNLGKSELDPPTNEAFFDSYWKGPIEEMPSGENESKQVSSDVSRFLFANKGRPRHRTANSP